MNIKRSTELIETIAMVVRTDIMGDDIINDMIFDNIQNMDIDVLAINSDEHDAFTLWDSKDSRIQIFINVNQRSLPEQRYAIAHELGRIVLLKIGIDAVAMDKNVIISILYKGNISNDNSDNSEELMVTDFAMSFLMPQRYVESVIDVSHSCINKINIVRKVFGVTFNDARNRLKTLELL